MIMGFLNFGKKKKEVTPTNSLGESLDELQDGELPWGWVAKFKDYYKPKDDKLSSLAVATKGTMAKEEKVQKLQDLIEYFYEYKNECQSKGGCIAKYFDNMWMHCKNSRSSDFIFITPYEDELKKLG